MEKYSVLMGIYKKTNPEYLKKSIDSMLTQSVRTNDFVIVADGEIPEELEKLLAKYDSNNPGIFNLVRLEKNSGLGVALKTGVINCKNRLIARMDDDDISYSNRCETQLVEFENDPTLDLVGGYIDEFSDDEDVIIAQRKVPLTSSEMLVYSKKRSPVNHVTVMFDRDTVIRCNNYSEYRLCQDVELWARMLHEGCNLKNLPVSLVKVRFDENACLRRKNKLNIQIMIDIWNNFYNKGYCSKVDYLRVKYTQLIVGCLPAFVIKRLYKVARKMK